MQVVQLFICRSIRRKNKLKLESNLERVNIQEMTSNVERHIRLLEVFKNSKPKLRQSIIENSDAGFIDAVVEICDNYLKGHVRCTKEQYTELCKHKRCMREIVNLHKRKSKKTATVKEKSRKNIKALQRRILLQKGGAFWTVLLTPIVAELSSYLLSKALKR